MAHDGTSEYSSFPVDIKRVQSINEESLNGVCSRTVISATDQAVTALEVAKSNEVILGGNTLYGRRLDDGRRLNVEGQLYLRQTDNEDGEWVEIGIRQTDDDQVRLPVVSFKDRTATKQCSIAVFRPVSPLSKQWADTVIATTEDEKLQFMIEDGEIRYVASAVQTLLTFLLNPSSQLEFQRFSETFRLQEYFYEATDIARARETPEYAPSLNSWEFLAKALVTKLGKISVGEQLMLEELVNRTETIGDSYIITTNLSRTGPEIGKISWIFQAGYPEKPIADPVQYAPGVIVNALELEGQAPSFIPDPTETDKQELSPAQTELLYHMSRNEGHRNVFALPPANDDQVPSSKEQETRLVVSDFETANQNLANHLEHFRQLALVNDPEFLRVGRQLESHIGRYQIRFADRVEVLDLGAISLPPAQNTKAGMFNNMSNIRLKLEAPGWNVFAQSRDCYEVKVSGAASAFTGATRPLRCEASDCVAAFDSVEQAESCTAVSGTSAFFCADTATSCATVNVESAFESGTNLRDCTAQTGELAFSNVVSAYNCVASGFQEAFCWGANGNSADPEAIIGCRAENTGLSFSSVYIGWRLLDRFITYQVRKSDVHDSVWVSGQNRRGNPRRRLRKKIGKTQTD